MKRTLVAALSLGAVSAVSLSAPSAEAFWYSPATWASTGVTTTFNRLGEWVTYAVGTPSGVVNAAVSANNTTYTNHRVQADCHNVNYWEIITGPSRAGVTVGGFDNHSFAYCVRGGEPRRGRAQLNQ